MALLVPPPAPPRFAITEEDGPRRFRLRMTQVSATLVTLLATVWICTFGVIPAILAVMVAKHVLVAVLMMGLGVDAPKSDR